jgi:DNA-binding NtrC family response regulator
MKGPILVIDDEASIRDMLGTYFEMHGYEVKRAASAEAALRLCADEKIKLITLDIVLPDTDGLEFLEVLRGRYPQIPIIVATGNDPTPTLINTAKERGASGFASKTAPLPDLLQQVETLIGLQ